MDLRRQMLEQEAQPVVHVARHDDVVVVQDHDHVVLNVREFVDQRREHLVERRVGLLQ
ncbi:MAG: hypothetical protein M3P91_03840 [Actinomycetota bacterium]|nr:hypothetical protein [Actinomycetota bacterium]